MHRIFTHRVWRSLLLTLLLLPLALWATWRGADTAPTDMDLLFVENVGQFAPEVAFQILGLYEPGWVTTDALWVGGQRYALAHAASSGREPQPVTLSYFQGSGGDDWHEGVPVWGSLALSGVAPGYDLALDGAAGHLRWRWEHTRLTLTTPPDPLPDWSAGAPSRPADVAPTGTGIVFGTFLGADLTDEASEIALAADGDVVIAGTTFSPVFPAPEGSVQHGVDVFIARLAADGSALDYALHINPPDLNAPDYGLALALDPAGNAYVTGRVESAGFPTTPGAYDESYNGDSDAFASSFAPDGTLLYSTFLGGADFDLANDIVVDDAGIAYVAGSTWSTDFLTNTVGTAGARSSFVLALTPDGSALGPSVIVGGSGQDEATALTLSGGALIAGGWTNSSDWPTSPGSFQPGYGGATDGFLLRLNPFSLGVFYSSYLGGSGEDRVYAVGADVLGRPVSTGLTRSADFPVSVGAYDEELNDGVCGFCADGFVVRLSAAGSALSYGTYLGGAAEDWGNDVVVESAGGAAVAGRTESADFPTTADAFGAAIGGTRDGFVARLAGSGSTLAYGSYLGGAQWDEATSLVTQGAKLTLAGRTESADFPVSAGAYDPTHNGDADAFVLQLDLAAPPPTETPTATATATPTLTRTPTLTPGPSPTSTGTPTYTPTATPGPSPTSTGTVAPTPSSTATMAAPSTTPTVTATATPSGGELYLPVLRR